MPSRYAVPMSRPAALLVLTDDDRIELARLSQGGSPRLAERARIVLACAESAAGNTGVAAELGLTTGTVRKWRARFAEAGLDGLADHDRPGRPKAGLDLTGGERDQLVRWARRGETAQGLGVRARRVVARAPGGA